MSETSKKRLRANTQPDPETTPHITDEQEGQSSSSRLEASKEPAQDEEKRRVAEKLRKQESDS
jgi:hypothetical protein